MKFILVAIAAAFATQEASAIDLNKPGKFVSGEEGIYRKRPYTYTYNDIRNLEFKCVADRNREWKYDAVNNLWKCKMIDWNVVREE